MKSKEEKRDYVLEGAQKVMEVIEGTLSKDQIEELDEDEEGEFDKDLNINEAIKAIKEEKKEFEEKGEIDGGVENEKKIKKLDGKGRINKLGKTAIEELDEEKELEALRRLEAVLFVSGRFLSLQELISYTDTNPIILRELLEKLCDKYENDEASALQIVNKNNLYKMDVKIEYNDIINRLATGRSEFTKAEKETLAIIAYKQPIKQSVVIKIRGNKAYDHIKKYVELSLIKKKKVGHTNELTLSDEFYDYFGMTGSEEGQVKEIPRIENIESDDEDEE